MFRVDSGDGLYYSILSEDENRDVSDINTGKACISAEDTMAVGLNVLEDCSNPGIDVNDRNQTMEYKSTLEICEGLRFILGMPELCDVEFLVGKDKTPVYAIKAILATRSKAFYHMIYSQQNRDGIQSTPQTKKGNGLMSKIKRFGRKGRSDKPKRACIEPMTATMSNTGKISVVVEQFDADCFRRLILYLHGGSVNVGITSVVGVMNAADLYGLVDLRDACFKLSTRFINVKTVLPLLLSTQAYDQFKWTEILVWNIMDFISVNAQNVLLTPEFEHIPKSFAISILLATNLRAEEEIKWDAALQWSRRHCHKKNIKLFRKTIQIFISNINFGKISISKLKREVIPLNVVPENVISTALDREPKFKSSGSQQGRQDGPPPKPPRKLSRRKSVLSAALKLTQLGRSK